MRMMLARSCFSCWARAHQGAAAPEESTVSVSSNTESLAIQAVPPSTTKKSKLVPNHQNQINQTKISPDCRQISDRSKAAYSFDLETTSLFYSTAWTLCLRVNTKSRPDPLLSSHHPPGPRSPDHWGWTRETHFLREEQTNDRLYRPTVNALYYESRRESLSPYSHTSQQNNQDSHYQD